MQLGKKFRDLRKKIITLLNRMIPKNNKLIYIYGFSGYRDNNKAIGDYLINKGYLNEYKLCVYVPKKYYREKDFTNEVKVIHSNLLMVIHFIMSKYIFYSYEQIKLKPSKKQTVIHMWHGSPLKKIENLEREEKRENCFFTKLFATSEYFKTIMSQAFSCKLDQVVLCGQPRNDILFKKNRKPKFLNDDEKLVLWTPTYRKATSINRSDGNLKNIIPIFLQKDYDCLNEYLKKNKIKLLIKLHPAEDIKDSDMISMTNMYILSHKKFVNQGYEIYPVLSNANALISDYSSIYFDYLLLDRPIAFTLEDMDQYKNNRGFVMDNPLDFMPGEKIYSKKDFYKFIDNIANGIDKFKKERNRVNDLVNYYKDGNNCKRTLEIAGIKIK